MKILLFSLRHALFIVLFSTIGSRLYSQGDLQFNQVKRFSNQSVSVTSGTWVSAGSITVPTSKVWKIESSSVTFPTNCGFMLAVDGQTIFTGLNTSGGYTMNNLAPIWLPAGTYPITVWQNSTSTITLDKIKISAIEFNIIP